MVGYKTFLDECNKELGEDAYVTDYDLENNGIAIPSDCGTEHTVYVRSASCGTVLESVTVKIFSAGELAIAINSLAKTKNVFSDIKNNGHFYKQSEGEGKYRYHHGKLKEV